MQRIAVVGTGISGSLIARLLATQHEVTVFEANDYIGGHANTVNVEVFGKDYPLDTGFMVFNAKTYLNFCRMLQTLGIPSQDSDMSFSVQCERTGMEYSGSNLNGLFAQRSNLFSPSFIKMLKDILTFNRCGMRAAETGELRDGSSVGEFLSRIGVGRRFVDHYLVPMAAAIWSSDPGSILSFPAEFMIGFYANHGLMQLRDRPQWMTIPGGSRRYQQALLAPLGDQVKLSNPVRSVCRQAEKVAVIPTEGPHQTFDHVVFATHADQTLRMLQAPETLEQAVLKAFPYQSNEAILHVDRNLLPRRKRAWASWNYHIPDRHAIQGVQNASLTYDLSRLQLHDSPTPLLLTLNRGSKIDPTKVLRTFEYDHPAYSTDSIAAQQQHHRVSGRDRVHFCGAYWGYGFHEDGVKSALQVAEHFNLSLDDLKEPVFPVDPTVLAGS